MGMSNFRARPLRRGKRGEVVPGTMFPSMRAGALWLLLYSSAAGAVDVRYQAKAAEVSFTHTRRAFPSYGFDTQWLPPTGPVQVRGVAAVGGGFSASAPGLIRLGWQPTRAMWAEGRALAGYLDMNVGLEFHASLKLELHIPAGPTYTWEGPVPG